VKEKEEEEEDKDENCRKGSHHHALKTAIQTYYKITFI